MHTSFRGREDLANLNAELARAEIVAQQEVSRDVITMNSTVGLVDLDTWKETYTLVFPEAADIAAGKISVLAPVGTGMLGYEVGDVFERIVPDGTCQLGAVPGLDRLVGGLWHPFRYGREIRQKSTTAASSSLILEPS